ncbi:MAG: hypothetical protein ACLQVJ_02020 [Syntrophobacteraceae bacterium]
MRKSLIAGAVLVGALALAGQAAASCTGQAYNLNFYGASAQFQLFNQSAPTFLENQYSCSSSTKNVTSGNYGITTGTGCTVACTGQDTVTLRVTSKASYDGVLSLSGLAKTEDKLGNGITGAGSGTTNPNPYNFCKPGQTGWPYSGTYPSATSPSCCPGGTNTWTGGSCTDTCNYSYRVMYNTTAGDFNCEMVDVGLSDVNPTSFTQDLLPATLPQAVSGGNAKVFSSDPVTIPAGFEVYNPIVDPFGFYASTDVKYSTCSSGVNAGQQCSAASQCPTKYDACTAGVCVGGSNNGNACTSPANCPDANSTCTPATITNISKLQAVLIFSRQAFYWSDLGAGYSASSTDSAYGTTSAPIIACYRVAGSGTLATLDYGVMRNNGFAISGLIPNIDDGDVGPPWPNSSDNYVKFNDGTGAEMNCVNSYSGAVGFADADQALSMLPLSAIVAGKANSYPNVTALSYGGIVPSRRALRNGEYDNFYAKEYMIVNPSNPDLTNATTGPAVTAMITNMYNALATPAGVNATDRKDFWAAYGETSTGENNGTPVNAEMRYMKSSDKVYPAGVTPTTPQTP